MHQAKHFQGHRKRPAPDETNKATKDYLNKVKVPGHFKIETKCHGCQGSGDDSNRYHIVMPFHGQTSGVTEDGNLDWGAAIPFYRINVLDSYGRETWDLEINPWEIMHESVDKRFLVISMKRNCCKIMDPSIPHANGTKTQFTCI